MVRPLSYSGFLLLLVMGGACGGPTSPSSSSPKVDAVSPEASPQAQTRLAPRGNGVDQIGEEFNCTDVMDVHVRFSDPGYVAGTRAGLYASYEGVPAGDKVLRLWWDYDNDPTSFQNIHLGQGEVRRENDQLFDLEVLAEHLYAPPPTAQDRTVRAELIILGQTGNCARNRTITITPSASPDHHVPASPEPTASDCRALRFCELGDGRVRDNVTGLVWLRDAGCFPFRRFQGATADAAALANGQCGLSDGSSPGDWRLPTLEELSSLLDPRFNEPRLSNAAGDGQWKEGDAFFGVRNQAFWTTDLQEGCVGQLPGAMVVDVGNGDARCRITALGIARFWPIRAR